MRLGILQRYVIGQVLRSFGLVLVTLTSVIVLVMIMAQAAREGLAPKMILLIIPFIVPQTLVFTVPVALLFAVSVIYGRLASDNEVVATKAAGLSAWVLLWPSLLLSLVLSGGIAYLSAEFIPRSSFNFKMSIFKDAEDTFYLALKREGQINNPNWPLYIGVRDVDMDKRVLIDATFKHRPNPKEKPNDFDMIAQAKRANIRFNTLRQMIEITLHEAVISSRKGDYSQVPHHKLEYPMQKGGPLGPDKKVQEMTTDEMRREKARVRTLLANERNRQALAASLWIGTGRIGRVDWPHIRDAYRDYQRWQRQMNELETEAQFRMAMASGGFFFVLLGAPVGIYFARRDFLSAFIVCFVPIIAVYYPLVLMGVNLGKEGLVPPMIAWGGNLFLGLVAGFFALPPVMKH